MGLALSANQAGVEQRQSVAADLDPIAGTFVACDHVGRIDRLCLLAVDSGPDAEQAVGRVGETLAVVGDAVGENVRHRDLEGDREDVEPGEDIGGRSAACAAGRTGEVAIGQVHEVEDALFVKLIRIVKLAGDDAARIRQRLDIGVHERLIVEAHFAARRIRIIAPERAQAVDKAVGLRAMVVGQDFQVLAQDDIAVSILVFRACNASDGHQFRAAGELPQKFIAAAYRIVRSGRLGGRDRVGELDTVDDLVGEAGAFADVEFIPVAVARTEALVALAGFVQWIEIHNQVQLVVRAGGYPGVGIGVVCAGFVQYGERLAVARCLH